MILIAGNRSKSEQREKPWRDNWCPADVGEDLHPTCPEIANGALGPAHRGVDVVQRERRHEPGKPITMPRDEVGHPVVGPSGEIGRVGGAGVGLQRRRGEGANLLIALEGVHDAEPHVEIDEHRDATHPFARVLVVGRQGPLVTDPRGPISTPGAPCS